MSEHEPSVDLRIYANSITVDEHRELRRAVDAASVEGTVTWLKNSAGAPIAAIVPLERVSGVCLRHLEPCAQRTEFHRNGERCR